MARPLTMSGLRLSKVPSTPCTSRPPFGASGLTYGAATKSLAIAGSPCLAMACAASAATDVTQPKAMSAQHKAPRTAQGAWAVRATLAARVLGMERIGVTRTRIGCWTVGECNRMRAGALSLGESGLSGSLLPGCGVTLLPHSASNDRSGGTGAPVNARTIDARVGRFGAPAL